MSAMKAFLDDLVIRDIEYSEPFTACDRHGEQVRALAEITHVRWPGPLYFCGHCSLVLFDHEQPMPESRSKGRAN